MLKETDLEIYQIIEKEKQRQSEGIELIPSENYISQAVMEAMGSVLNNKYSEGYPRKRYYGGQQYIDEMEELAIKRAKDLFGAEHVNVQPYSGSPANIEALMALLEPGDKIMGMNLSHGGHLTHGHPVSFSGRLFKVVQYGLNKDTCMIDYDEVRKMALEEKPKLIISGATAYPRTIDFQKFADIAKEINAYSLSDVSHVVGLIIGEVHPSPFPFTDVVTTTTHKTLRGPRGGMIMCKNEYAEKIDKSVFPGAQGGPHDHINAAKAVALKEASTPEFKEYASQIVKNAKVIADELMSFGFNLVSNGTDNHLILVDLRNKQVTGKEAEVALDKVGLTVNKNAVPYDDRPPFDPSGIRLGSPAATTRGMQEGEMKKIARWINEAIENRSKENKLNEIREDVR
ncbi:serine hydroxymethyltransferase, partial [bacterium CG_4_8_14_3_um_filter_33_28]